MATLGGPASNVSIVADGRPRQGGPALPVAVVTDGRAIEGDRAIPIYVVTSGPMQAGPATPIVEAAVSASVVGGPAIPVYVVAGALVLAYTEKVYSIAPLNLLAYWPQADAAGATVMADESGNNRSGVYKAAGEPLLGQLGIGDGRTAALYDGTNDYGNAFTASLQSAFNSSEGTVAQWVKVSAAGVWTDATTRRTLQFQADANNLIRFGRGTVNNQFVGAYTAGGVTSSVVVTTAGPTGWVHWALTWSKSADAMKLYMNGVQQGATQTGLGTWAGNLAATTTCLGANGTAGANPWSGFIAHAAIWNSALSAAQIAQLAVVS